MPCKANHQAKPRPKISSPYNFVPLNKEVYIPGWGSQISHDLPFSDGEDGMIVVTFRNRTPLYVRGPEVNGKPTPEHLTGANGNMKYFIPGSSIRGMVRSIVEILSFGELEFFNNLYFGYRDFNQEVYKDTMDKVECGWLTLNNRAFEVSVCGKPEPIAIDDIPENLKKENKNTLFKNLDNPELNGKHLVFTGDFRNKKHEYLFPIPAKKTLTTLSESAAERFIYAYRTSPYCDEKNKKSNFVHMLENGRKLPVFFTRNTKGEIEYIGLTRMFRLPFQNSVKNGISQTSKDINGYEVKGIDLCKCIFGDISSDGMLKGRVQFGNAFMNNNPPLADLRTITGVLASPKPSYYPVYLRQDKAPYNNYNSSNIEIAGRKRYRIHRDNDITALPEGNDNNKVKSVLVPLKEGNTFKCEIAVHNLRPVEIGALISALTFHGQKESCLSIGMGKSFGFGKLSIDKIEFRGLKGDEKQYLKAFEKEMNTFVSNCEPGKNWLDSPQLRTLRLIAKEHNHNVVRYMSLKDYQQAKMDKNFFHLEENKSGFVMPGNENPR